jgi:NAD(P)-dependent dehydrogenase (short-subunit alcohol dehydrogenase family)
MDNILRDKVAVLTGASTGIGKAIAVCYATHGASVALVGRNKERLNLVKQSIIEIGRPVKVFLCDLSNQASVRKVANDIADNYKHIDILVNAAGVWHDNKEVYYGKRLDQIPFDQINEVLDVNTRAPMLLTSLLLPTMIQNRSGKVLNISGTFSNGGAKWLHYFISKQALESMTIGLADELREFNIQVNCISPSDVKTEAYQVFYPESVDTALEPKDVADLALYLVSNKSENISGQVIVIKNHEDI